MADAPFVSHVSELRRGDSQDGVIATVLGAVESELAPLAATFFRVGADGEIASAVVQASDMPTAGLLTTVRAWMAGLRGLDPLTPDRLASVPGRPVTTQELADLSTPPPSARLRELYRRIGVVDDVRMPIRRDGRVIAGVTLWRRYGSRPWSAEELRRLEALQPLAEAAYVHSCRAAAEGDRLPAKLTPRQREVALLLAAGASNVEVARSLRVSPDTAKTHTRAVLEKLGLRSRKEVATRLDLRGASGGRWSTEDASRRVLALLLDWAAKRVGAVAAGSALVSPRPEILASASALAPSCRGHLDRQLVRRLHGLMLRPLSPPKALERLAAEHGVVPVAEVDALADWRADPIAAGILEQLDATVPALIALRLQGRLAGLGWLALRRGAEGEAVAATRRLHALIELASLDPLRATLAPRSGQDGLASYGLTPREATIAELAIAGASNEEIARRLWLSVSTVKNHMTRVLAKCGVRSRAQLIALRRDLTQRS